MLLKINQKLFLDKYPTMRLIEKQIQSNEHNKL